MNRYIILLVLLIAHQDIFGQQSDDLTKQVTVTRSFDPSIKSATKSMFTPREESIYVEPEEFEYYINPTPITYPLTTTKLSREDVDISQKVDETSVLAKAALGVSLQSLLDLYLSHRLSDNVSVGACFNHYGYYGKLTNDIGVKESAGEGQNRLAAYLNYRKSKVYANVRLGFSHDSYKQYGYLLSVADDYDIKQRYNVFDVHFELGTPFSSYNRGINGKFTVDMTTGSNIAGIGDTQTKIGVEGGGPVGLADRSSINFEFSFTNLNRGSEFESLVGNRNAIEIAPMYRYKGGVADLRVGAKYIYSTFGDNIFDEKANRLMPILSVEFSSSNGSFVPYIKLDGEYDMNSFISLSGMNPYISSGETPASVSQSLYAGIKGKVKSILEYNLYAGVDDKKNMIMFANSGYGNTFTPIWCDNRSFMAGAEMAFKLSKSFRVDAQWRYNNYGEEVYGLADHRGSVAVTYNYQDLFTYTLKSDINGSRNFISDIDSGVYSETLYNQVDLKADISMAFSYNYSRSLALFAEFRNILNESLYDYNFYRGMGFNVMIGAKFKF